MRSSSDFTERDRLVRTFAYEFVVFNHDPDKAYLVTDITDDCMLELFSPSLFRLAPKTATNATP